MSGALRKLTDFSILGAGLADTAVLFDETSSEQQSAPFSVFFGGGVLLSAYGLGKIANPDNTTTTQRAVIEKVRYDTHGMPFREGGCDATLFTLDAARVIYAEDVTQCGLWFLDPCQNTVIITVPGMYRVTLTDLASVGYVYMEAVRLNADALRFIPQDLILGKLNHDCGC